MTHACKEKDESSVTEMAIVNTFTKLIFGDDAYTMSELSIIEAFQAMDDTLARDSYKAMGEYLRNQGVREMIQLVSGLRQYLSRCPSGSASSYRKPVHAPRTG